MSPAGMLGVRSGMIGMMRFVLEGAKSLLAAAAVNMDITA
jgi:hypothetical protein